MLALAGLQLRPRDMDRSAQLLCTRADVLLLLPQLRAQQEGPIQM